MGQFSAGLLLSQHCVMEGREEVGLGEIMCLFNSQVSRSRGASPTSKPDVDHKIGNLSPCCDWPPRVLGRGEYILHVGGL